MSYYEYVRESATECPRCGQRVANVQGVSDCPSCGWADGGRRARGR